MSGALLDSVNLTTKLLVDKKGFILIVCISDFIELFIICYM